MNFTDRFWKCSVPHDRVYSCAILLMGWRTGNAEDFYVKLCLNLLFCATDIRYWHIVWRYK
jgi:hypothetical protein